ncbi:ABC transporter permease [Lysinibacillus yapensis]|uniref:ABC transporter permease n=1 Tax=Ureibacillus yapensis TaxID=2304605 RepID=A0A396SA47_9BACL|nr:ABC transporter permease subunit [Lysinibacillus yapensis]RHW36147.1 ABC transporter permease [Lysinibacillus yapensis]
MNRTVLKAITKKDIKDIFRSKTLLLTIILIPVIFSLIIPAGVVSTILYFDFELDTGTQKMLDKFLLKVGNEEILAFSLKEQLVYLFVNYMMVSLFLLIPVITASTIAANSLVGEKERKTLESLLFAPITVKELFISKILSSFIPAFSVSLISFILSGIIINGLSYSTFKELIFPSMNWIVLVLLLLPMVLILTILLNVLISSRVKTYQEATNLGGIIVLPVLGILIGQVSGLFFLGLGLMVILSTIILIINLVLLRQIAKYNDRHLLFEKQI